MLTVDRERGESGRARGMMTRSLRYQFGLMFKGDSPHVVYARNRCGVLSLLGLDSGCKFESQRLLPGKECRQTADSQVRIPDVA